MLGRLRVPLSWGQLARRTVSEIMADNCLGLAAQLAYYFFLALFPALLFLVAVVSFIPVTGLLDMITSTLARVAPTEVLSIIQEQILDLDYARVDPGNHVVADRLPARPGDGRSRPVDWILGGLVLAEAVLLTYSKLHARLTRLRA